MALVQWYGENWAGEGVRPGFSHEADGVLTYIDEIRRDGALVHMTLRYEAPLGVWTHRFTFEPLDRTKVEAAFTGSALRLDRFLDPQQTWIIATAI